VDTVAIDWSGARDPRQTLWFGIAREGQLVGLSSGLTRESVIELIVEMAQVRTDPLVVGLDFAFSLPEWFLRERQLASARHLWELVDRDGEDWLDQCQPPFWGRPGRRRPELEEHYRQTDLRFARVGGTGIKSPFQIGGAGTVGTSSLRGMPVLARLQDAGFAIWPFDDPRVPIVVEIYPRALTGAVVKSDRHEREQYLRRRSGFDANPHLLEVAAGSQDSFDAAVSAIVMSEHAHELAHLPRIDDRITRLEGEIWAPSP
jgi:hypothetical protein